MPEPLNRRGRFSKEAIARDPEAYKFSKKLASIRKRCSDTNDISYKYYGAKGIKVCEEWAQDTESFIRWAKETYPKDDKNYWIERIDINQDYSPENCTWATPKEQANNRSNNTFYKEKTLSQWADSLGCKVNVITNRIARGWTLEEATTVKPRQYKKGKR